MGGEFWGLFPEHVLDEGSNEVRAYVVDGPIDDPVFHPLDR
jgi:hypothetical protein